LTCQNRQDLNFWLAKDLCLKHEGESVNGAEKILQRELKRFGMDCGNPNGAEYLQMAMSKVAGNGAVDKVPGLWKAEWINRKTGDFGAAGFTRWILQYGFSGVLTSKNTLEMDRVGGCPRLGGNRPLTPPYVPFGIRRFPGNAPRVVLV
jgi:hypothetical protein